jgi:hypothetical protein
VKPHTIKFRIAPGTPPGDYDLTWGNASFIKSRVSPAMCTNVGLGMKGTLRVLP